MEAIFSYLNTWSKYALFQKTQKNKVLLNKQRWATSEPENSKILSNSEFQMKKSVAYIKKSVY